MPIANFIIRWIVIVLLAYGYGSIVQYALGYDRGKVLLTLSIGALGIIIGKFLLHPLSPIFNIHQILHLGGIPVVASLIGSFIIPGIMWLLRKEGPILNSKKQNNS